MADLSVGQSLAVQRQQQDDAITTAPPIRDVTTSSRALVPFHLGALTRAPSQALQSKRNELHPVIASLTEQSLANTPLAFAHQRMKLEGMALEVVADTSYQNLHRELAEMGGRPHPMLSGHDEARAFSQDFTAFLLKPQEQRDQDGGFTAVWDAHCARVGDTLGAYHTLCEDVIKHNDNPADLPHLTRSHEAFRGYAKGVVQDMSEDMPKRLGTFLTSRIEHAQTTANDPTLRKQTRDDARYELNQLQAVRTELQGFISKKDEDQPKASTPLAQATKANEGLDNALKNVAREDTIKDLKAHSGLLIGAAVFLGAGIPQGVASAGHFGASTSAIDERMANEPFINHTAATSAVLGGSHKLISDGIRPFVQASVDKTIGRTMVKVDPMSVYPTPLKDISVDGRRVANPDFARQDTTRADQRKDFKRLQNANNFGTMSGDFAGYLAFGTAHALRELLNQYTSLNTTGIGARSLASAAGGTFMAGGQAVAKYAQTHGDERIPTYRVTQQTKDWGKVMPETLRDVLGKLNPLDMANLSDLINRIVGAFPGIEMRTGVGDAALAQLKSAAAAIVDATGMTQKPGDLEKMVMVISTLVSSGLTLHPFFANSVAAPLENKALHGEDKLASRASVPVQNILHPDRDSLPHTQPAGVRRTLENAYHVSRGVSQLGPQSVVAGINVVSDAIKDKVSGSKKTATPDPIELAERGQATTQGTPADEGQTSTRPT